jgi:[acyl-carrier-protein] S-malonyltransferase
LTSIVRVNTNHPLCHIFSGRLGEINDFLQCAGQAGAFKAQRLEVEIPYHHPEILAAAPRGLMAYLDAVTWSRARFPIVSTIDGACLVDPGAIIDFVAQHLACPISWQRACETLRGLGVDTVYECGPGVSLTRNARFLPFEMAYTNVKKDLRCPTR